MIGSKLNRLEMDLVLRCIKCLGYTLLKDPTIEVILSAERGHIHCDECLEELEIIYKGE